MTDDTKTKVDVGRDEHGNVALCFGDSDNIVEVVAEQVWVIISENPYNSPCSDLTWEGLKNPPKRMLKWEKERATGLVEECRERAREILGVNKRPRS